MRRWLMCLLLIAAGGCIAASPPQPRPLAIVADDDAALRGAPRDAAPLHARLMAGDLLELRGERGEFLQVYDHRRERAGFVRTDTVRVVSPTPEQAPALRAVLLFLRDTVGAEALGLGYAAAFLRAAAPEDIDADVLDALGTLADRLATRASRNRQRQEEARLAAQLEVATHLGVGIHGHEHEGRIQLCYEGDAFRRVLAQPAAPVLHARAALALTREECIDPALPPRERHALDAWRAGVLDRVAADDLPEHLRQRLHIRRAAVWATLAHHLGRQQASPLDAARRALAELARVDGSALSGEDAQAWTEAAIRVGASRWAAEPAVQAAAVDGLRLTPVDGSTAGETCVELRRERGAAAPVLARRCTFATLYLQSVRTNPTATMLTLAAQPLPGWRELWVFRQTADGWRVDVLPPGTDVPSLGYVEFAGWLPERHRLLTAREVRRDGRYVRHFEVFDLDRMQVVRQADAPEHLTPFYRGQDAVWKRVTVSLR